jgi:hypothetical protein
MQVEILPPASKAEAQPTEAVELVPGVVALCLSPSKHDTGHLLNTEHYNYFTLLHTFPTICLPDCISFIQIIPVFADF